MKNSASGTVLVCLLLLSWLPPDGLAGDLHLFAGAGMRQPVDRLVERYQDHSGRRVFVEYGGSGRLLARIAASQKGDLFMPGAYFYIQKLHAQGRILTDCPLVRHTPVVGVNRRQNIPITRFEDLARPGLRLALGDPKAMAMGRISSEILERSGLQAAIRANVVVHGATVKQLSLYVAQGSVDAAIIGRADSFQCSDKIRLVEIPAGYYQPEIVALAVLGSTSDAAAAREFLEFMRTPASRQEFENCGFLPLETDRQP